jgi:peptide/nickel transport system substrate-binding protein
MPSATPADINAILYGDHYSPDSGTPGGDVVVADWQAATQLNYYFSNSVTNAEVIAATMHTLLTVSADGHWKPDLSDGPITFADNVTLDASGGGFTVHLKLKSGLMWSDGQPFTADDIAFTWKWVTDKQQAGIGTLGWEEVDRVEVVSDLTADVHFKEPFAGWLGTVGGNVILPPHYVSKFPIKSANSKTYPLTAALRDAVTIGPFKYAGASSTSVELVRDANWRGPALACSGQACLDRITFQFFPDNKDGEIAAFKAGEVDVALGLNQGDYDAIKDVNPATGSATVEPAWLYEHLDMNEAGLGPGKGHPALKDIVVRKALAQAIDKQELYRTVFPGLPVPENACTNATPTNYWQLADAACPAFDVAAANKALDDAGYTRGADGVRVDPKSGARLVFENCTSNATFRVTEAEFLARAFDAIGIKLNQSYVDSTGVLFATWGDIDANAKCNLAHGTYDLSEFAYQLSFDLFGDYYYSYHSEQIPTDANKGNGYNTVRLNDPGMDRAIDRLKAAIDPAEQLDAAYAIQRAYVELVPEIALYYRNDARGISVHLHNFAKNPSTATDVWNAQDWWLAP